MCQDPRIGGALNPYNLARAAITLALGIALALPAGAAAQPIPSTVAKTVRVKSSGTTSATLRCTSPQAVSLAGAVIATSSGVTARDSLPRGISRWTFRFTALSGARPRRARVVLRCLQLRRGQGVSDVGLRVFTRRLQVTTRALSSRRVRLVCARGFVPTGYGLDRSFSSTAGPLPEADLRLAMAVPSTRSWVFRLENAGGSDSRPELSVRCLKRNATARRGNTTLRQRLELQRARFSDRVGRGSREQVTHSCPFGHFSLGQGHLLRANDDIFVRRSYPFAARSGRWTFDHQTGASQRVRTYLSCLSLGTSFR